MLTATGRRKPRADHVRHCRSTSFSTKCVSGRSRTVFSTKGMKSSGVISPRCGWCHRISASAPDTRPSDSRTFGW